MGGTGGGGSVSRGPSDSLSRSGVVKTPNKRASTPGDAGSRRRGEADGSPSQRRQHSNNNSRDEFGGEGGGGGVSMLGGAGGPSDLTNYILELEGQNRDLRRHVLSLQDELLATQNALVRSRASPVISGGGGALVTHDDPEIAGMLTGAAGKRFETDSERKAFLTDVLSQIEVVIQAHRNKTAGEIQKYKFAAESAQRSLKELRETIEHEGMGLSLNPSMLAIKRRGGSGESNGEHNSKDRAASNVGLSLPPQANALLEEIAKDVVHRILSAESAEDVPDAVHHEVRKSFRVLVEHFCEQVVAATKDSAAMVEDIKKDAESAKADLRMQLHSSEERRVRMVRDHELEISALRDELEAYHRASASDDIQASLHQRAMEEYNFILVEAKQEAATLRDALEEERTHSAEVCLKLKSALQRRSTEFEKAIVEKAEAAITEKEAKIESLEEEVKKLRAPPVPKRDVGAQAGDSNLLTMNKDSYVGNVLKSIQRTPADNAAHDEEYERSLLRKTQDLIAKYGRGGSNPNAMGAASAAPNQSQYSAYMFSSSRQPGDNGYANTRAPTHGEHYSSQQEQQLGRRRFD